MTSSKAIVGDSCLLVPEDTVRALMAPAEIFTIVRSASLRSAVRHGPAVSTELPDHSIRVRAGGVDGSGFGVKVRAGADGNYLSVAWDNDRQLTGLVESSYLTYYRTAAILLLPVTELCATVSSVLVMGSGRLGQACAILASELFPGCRIQLWSRSSREIDRECADVVAGWWAPAPWQEERFDLVVTCTRAATPLPLETLDPPYVSVGGATDGQRRELPGNLLRGVGAIYADSPAQALLRCRDLDTLAHGAAVRPLSELIGGPHAIAGRTLTFVTGGGGYDALLAGHVLRLMADRGYTCYHPSDKAEPSPGSRPHRPN